MGHLFLVSSRFQVMWTVVIPTVQTRKLRHKERGCDGARAEPCSAWSAVPALGHRAASLPPAARTDAVTFRGGDAGLVTGGGSQGTSAPQTHPSRRDWLGGTGSAELDELGAGQGSVHPQAHPEDSEQKPWL